MNTALHRFADLPGAPFASRHLQPFSGQDIRTLIGIQGRRRADHPYLVWRPFQGPRRVWTYAQFAQALDRFAAGLAARGIRPGDRVLVLASGRFGLSWAGHLRAMGVAVSKARRPPPRCFMA